MYLSKTGDNCWKEKSQWFEKMLQEIAILQLISYIRIKREDVTTVMKFTGGILGRKEKIVRKPLRLDKKQNGETHISLIL